MIDFYHFHDQLWWWKTFRVVMYYIDVPWFIPGAEKRKLEILMSSHLCTVLSIFPVSKYSFVYIFHHSLLLQHLKKDEVSLLDWQASDSCVPTGRRCSLTLHWCQPGRQGLMRIFNNVVRIPSGDDRLLQWLMLNWPAHKVNSCLLAIVNKAKND